MHIKIIHGCRNAGEADGLAVIIDVFRAFSVEAILLQKHAKKIIPVGGLEQAWQLKQQYPAAVLCGERGGAKVEGFDFGNSPSQLEHADLTGKAVIHTTSAGTQGIANAVHAEEILGGCLLNAEATAAYIRKRQPQTVSLVCTLHLQEPETGEDYLCARYLQSLLEDRPLADLQDRIEALKQTTGAKFFDSQQQQVFPEQDFHLCTRVNTVPFFLRLTTDPETGLPVMEKIEP